MTSPALSSHAALTTGTVLGERFEIESVVGEGAMGVVFRAKDRATGQLAAVKVLHKQLTQSREYLSRFRREANAASRFRHDNAVRVLGTGETEDRAPYIAMELVVGKSLKEIVASDAPMQPGRASNLVAQLLRALGAAHRAGIVHRDMKPDNIRVAVDEDGIERPKILDFGVAKFIAGDMGEMTGGLKTKTGIVLGTPKYMAPEQIRGEAIDGRADVYSVGALFHEMLTGKPPFEAEDVFGFVAMHLKERVLPIGERFPDVDVSEELDELVLTMLAKDPKERPGDAAALAEEVAKFAVEDPRAAEKAKALTRGGAAVVAGGIVGAAAGLFLASPGVAGAGSIAPAVAAASIGLGFGAAAAAKLFPRPSVYGFVKRIVVVAAAVVVCGAATIPVLTGPSVPTLHASFVVSAFALTALLSYVGYLVVWNAHVRALRALAAGVVAPLIAVALLPVLVAPANHGAYFVQRFASPAPELREIEDDARLRSLLGAASIGLAFGLASMLLPRPGAARK
jgi:hypothetical protein